MTFYITGLLYSQPQKREEEKKEKRKRKKRKKKEKKEGEEEKKQQPQQHYFFSSADIDECFHDNGGCDQVCENDPGAYHCGCELGFQLAADGYTCVGQSDYVPNKL